MVSRFRFYKTLFSILLPGILFAALLAGCEQPKQTKLPPTAPPALLRETSTPWPTSTPTGSPTPRATLRPSATAIPTATPLPSITPAPTATMTLPSTPFPALAPSQPYMVYYSTPGGKPSLVLLNADASGKQVLPLPENSQTPHLPQALSPDGKWLAFYTGTAGDPQKGPAGAGPFNLALNVMRLPDGKVSTVAQLLAKDYPESLRKLAAQVAQKDPSKALKETDVYNQIWSNFYNGITQAAWSPDGRTLAFVGEMDGQSSNIYLYTPATGTLKQMTKGSEQILWHLWSPDGKYIIYSSSNQACSGDCASRYALDLASGKTIALVNMTTHNGSLAVYDWTGPHTLAYYTYSASQGSSFLVEIDLATGKTTDLYPNAFVDFAIDSDKGLVALTANKDIVTQKNIQPGLYMYHPDSGKLDFAASGTANPDFSVVYWGQAQYPFLVWDHEKVYGLTEDSKLAVISENQMKTVAADRQWIVVMDAKANPPALQIIDGQKQVVKTVSARFAGRMFTNPDSTGFFSVYEKGLYYMDLKFGVWKQIDADLPDQPDWSSRALLFGWKP